MYLLNYIYFLIITLLGLKFLTMKRGVMVNPLNREQKMVMDGPEMFWVPGHSTLFIIYCLVSNRVELFSGSWIWISGNFEISLSSVDNAFCLGYGAG